MLAELWSDLRYRARALFRRADVEHELDDEMQFHLETEAQRLIRAGVPVSEARLRARAVFGGVEQVKEASRDGRGLLWLETTGQDLRYALRSLRHTPGFTAAVVLTLGLGIGANAAMFGVADRLLFRPPPFLDQARATHRVYLTYSFRGQDYTNRGMAYARYLDLTRWTSSFSAMAAFGQRDMAIGSGADARELGVQTVSASFFGMFSAKPALGRFFTSSEDTLSGGASVAVVSDQYWRTALGGRRDVLGQSLPIGALTYTIIGVAPPGFVGIPDDVPVAVFIPITTYASHAGILGTGSEWSTGYSWSWMQMLVRRKPGVTEAQAGADLTGAYLRSWNAEAALEPTTNTAALAKPRAMAAPVLQERGPQQSTVAKVVEWTSGIAVIVLLIACANVANLLLARALRRRREIALRLALGVSRARLIRQLLTETLLLGAISGVFGLLIARWVGTLLGSLFLPAAAASEGAGLLDTRTMVFASGAALLAGLITGMVPILQATRPDLVDALKAGAREGTYRHSRARTALLLAQGAMSVVLLVGAGLFTRSLRNVQSLRLGYDVDPVLFVQANLRGTKLTDEQNTALRQQLQRTSATLPGVVSATRAVTVPFWSSESQGLSVPGVDSVARLGRFALQVGSPEYFQTMGTRILRGRGMTDADRAGTPGTIVVSESMARALWPGQDPLGKCVKVGADTTPCSTVTGIAEDTRQLSINEGGERQYYLSIDQHPQEVGDLFVRVQGDAAGAKEMIRRALQSVMPGESYITVTPMHDIVDPNFKSWQLGATMFLVFGALALVLAAVGLYSVIAYDVAQRRHELGVRIALGARAMDVLRLVTRDGIRFALIGIGLGGVAALAAGRWIAPLLFNVTPSDPLVYSGVALTLISVAAVASMVPALRATRMSPSVALRSD